MWVILNVKYFLIQYITTSLDLATMRRQLLPFLSFFSLSGVLTSSHLFPLSCQDRSCQYSKHASAVMFSGPRHFRELIRNPHIYINRQYCGTWATFLSITTNLKALFFCFPKRWSQRQRNILESTSFFSFSKTLFLCNYFYFLCSRKVL
jgi:hypothetical protein